jgi:cytochrome c-type biogenesis protein CcmE
LEKKMIETQHRTTTQSRKRLTSRQLKLLVGGIIVVGAIGYLIFNAASGAAAYYLTIEELEEQGPSKRNVRVSGLIVGESIVWEPRDLRLEFEIVDQSGRLAVAYDGARPDMFQDGAEVVVEGRYTSEGIFEARTMLLKCPSKYEGEK